MRCTCLLLAQSGPRVAGSPCSNHPPFSVLVCADTMPSLDEGETENDAALAPISTM